MHSSSDEQIFPMSGIGVEHGRSQLLIISKASSPCTLQFRHGSDPTWYSYTPFNGTPNSEGVIMNQIITPGSPNNLRVKFEEAPAETVYYSLTTLAQSEF